MKKYLIIFLLLVQAFIIKAQNTDFINGFNCKKYFNESYGKFQDNRFDIIIPGYDRPCPLVIFIHGGGFLHGDKNNFYYRKEDIQYFLEHHIAVATLNYRFYKTDDSLGVRVCIRDIERAVQYIRFNALKYHIDKSRVGCYGTSAGAGSSLYLAFHDDMAIAGDTTLLGESTRIKCAGAISTQSTYDVFSWKKIIPWLGLVMFLKQHTLYNTAANFYGYPTYKSFKPHKEQIEKSLDILSMIDSNDPPVYLMNLQKGTFPKNIDIIEHHQNHAKEVSKWLTREGVKNYCYTYKKHQIEKEQDIDYPISKFFEEQLKQQ
ncbi:MAG: alpha/beta hydrolase [Bacteroidota bacterium]|nr:alpha/beta hydrolase [Bacteroidota bacterium]